MGSAHAGLLSTSRALRSLNLDGLVEANLTLKSRQRGFTEGQMIESLVLLQTLGGDCPEDIALLADDQCLARGLGYQPPKATAVRSFLNRFHDEELVAMRPAREVQKSFIIPPSSPQMGLDRVLAGLVGKVAALFKKHGQEQKMSGPVQKWNSHFWAQLRGAPATTARTASRHRSKMCISIP